MSTLRYLIVYDGSHMCALVTTNLNESLVSIGFRYVSFEAKSESEAERFDLSFEVTKYAVGSYLRITCRFWYVLDSQAG
jgi:hypothetical protein